MSKLTQIINDSAWKRCLEQFDNFHDSLLREAYLVSKGYVMPDHQMIDDATCDARLIFQSQDDRVPGLELIFEGVTEFRTSSMVIPEPIMLFAERRVEFALGGAALRDRSLVVARSAWYRLLSSNVLGNAQVVGSPIDVPV